MPYRHERRLTWCIHYIPLGARLRNILWPLKCVFWCVLCAPKTLSLHFHHRLTENQIKHLTNPCQELLKVSEAQ